MDTRAARSSQAGEPTAATAAAAGAVGAGDAGSGLLSRSGTRDDPTSARNRRQGAANVVTGGPRPLLRISVIGGVHMAYGGQEIPLSNRKALAILGYLALSQTGQAQREKLAGLFWSEFSERNARTTLRQAVHELRTALAKAGCMALTTSRFTIGLETRIL